MEVWGDCEGFYVCVCFGLYRKDITSRSALSVLVVYRRVVDEFVGFEGLPPYGFNVAVFTFGEGIDLWGGLIGE